MQKHDMTIVAHRLEDSRVKHCRTPHTSTLLIVPKFIVLHYTAGGSRQSTVNWFMAPSSYVSAHLVVGRKGKVTQMAPFNARCWHVGNSIWQSKGDLNSRSIGIEMANWGRFKDYKHRSTKSCRALSLEGHWWERYPDIQYAIMVEIVTVLCKEYSIPPENILGHSDVSPGRKIDPGPAWPMEQFREDVGTLPKPYDELYVVPMTCGCGGEAHIASECSKGYQLVRCDKRGCSVDGPVSLTKAEAVRRWNIMQMALRPVANELWKGTERRAKECKEESERQLMDYAQSVAEHLEKEPHDQD